MERYQIDPSNINLEITESATMEMKQTLLANMEKLIAYGVSFSLDDFGTGQSNLNYIVEMPVQIVKFDRVMTQAYFSSQKGRFVMNAAMHMIQDMKLGIVSEGIETQEQLTAMEQLGIDYIQGFYFQSLFRSQSSLLLLKNRNVNERFLFLPQFQIRIVPVDQQTSASRQRNIDAFLQIGRISQTDPVILGITGKHNPLIANHAILRPSCRRI